MAIDPANPSVLYAGTGEGFGNADATRGTGIYKTTDGGNSWNPMPSTTNPDFHWVNRMAISPTNSQFLLAALRIQREGGQAYGKIARSTDGGQTWAMTTFPAPMTDVRFRPSSGGTAPAVPNIPAVNCIASSYEGHVYYSSNHGVTWPAASGFPPPAGFQRVELAYSRSDPAIAYASKAGVGSSPAALYRSTDGGFSFSATSASPLANASWYNNVVWVDPFDSNTVLVGGVYMLRTRNGGQYWDEASSNSIHLDHHAIVEDPGYNGTTNKVVYGGNDGGIHRTDDILDTDPPIPSVSWTSLNNGLGVTQFYGAAGHVATGKIIGGTQDNHTLLSPVSGSQNWTKIFGFEVGGDGGFCAVDQTNDPYFYGEFTDLQICRSTDRGQSKDYIWDDPSHGIPAECGAAPCANFVAPFVLDPNNENRILGGGARLWRSNNVRHPQASQVSWAAIKPQAPGDRNYISAIAVAPGQSNIIWVGHNFGSVYYTTNGTATNPTWTQRNTGLPGRFCARITIGSAPPTNDPEAVTVKYATFGGFYPSPSDNRGNVWKTVDNGLAWTDIHHNLPAAPIYSLVVSPSNPNLLYVGTEVGVFASSNGGMTWSPGLGDPNVPVMELFWMGPKLVAATHGRGMFTLGGLATE